MSNEANNEPDTLAGALERIQKLEKALGLEMARVPSRDYAHLKLAEEFYGGPLPVSYTTENLTLV